jgi:hypothetical protein
MTPERLQTSLCTLFGLDQKFLDLSNPHFDSLTLFLSVLAIKLLVAPWSKSREMSRGRDLGRSRLQFGDASKSGVQEGIWTSYR